MSRPLRKETARRNEGLVLIEVLMAVVLLAFLAVPLVTAVQSAARRADMARSQAASVSVATEGHEAEDAWEWGEAVSSAWWRPGPTLHIRVEAGSGEEYVAGLWADGWFLGEWASADDGAIQVGAPVLTDVVGGELVVRVRSSGGVWGPPWRLVVPAADGLSALSDSGGSGLSGETVAHVPTMASPALWLSWADILPEATPLGLPFLLPPAGPGTCGADLDGRRQSWKMEDGRGLDIYF
jgi:hypothetical protein